MGFDLVPFLAAVARQDMLPGTDVAAAAQTLSSGMGIRLFLPRPLQGALIPGVEIVDKPDNANVILLVHRESAAATAAEAEQYMSEGRPVALLDAKYPDKGDMIQALLDSTVYLSNLLAYDTDTARVQAVLLTPIRDGKAHRHYLAHSILYNWAWRGIVESEVKRRFGDNIRANDEQRACNHARARLGAYLLHMGRRGLRFQIEQIGFRDGRLDRLWFSLK
jgi:hypothetical protein